MAPLLTKVSSSNKVPSSRSITIYGGGNFKPNGAGGREGHQVSLGCFGMEDFMLEHQLQSEMLGASVALHSPPNAGAIPTLIVGDMLNKEAIEAKLGIVTPSSCMAYFPHS